MIKTKNRHIFNTEIKIIYWVMQQKLPVNKFEWIEDISQFNEDFIKKPE